MAGLLSMVLAVFVRLLFPIVGNVVMLVFVYNAKMGLYLLRDNASTVLYFPFNSYTTLIRINSVFLVLI